MQRIPRFLCSLLNTYIYKYLTGTQRGAFFFFFSKVLERKKYLYIYIHTRNIKKKKKKNNLFRFGRSRIFPGAVPLTVTPTPPARRRAATLPRRFRRTRTRVTL